MKQENTVVGSCHCGNIAVTLHTNIAREAIELRRCDCSFCARHNPCYWSDPQGRLDVTVRDPHLVGRYRFGHGTADFVFCRVCGVFIFAVTEDGRRAVINMNSVLGPRFPVGEGRLHAEGEDEAAREARRARNWTPVGNEWPPELGT